MPITIKQLRSASWVKVFEYAGPPGFSTFSSDIPHLTITHETWPGRRTGIYYTVKGRRGGSCRTDSPSQAVRYWNEIERKEKLACATAEISRRGTAASAVVRAGAPRAATRAAGAAGRKEKQHVG